MNDLITLAGVPIQYTLLHPQVQRVFQNFRAESAAPALRISLTPEEIAAVRAAYPDDPEDAYIEMMELCPRTSDALLPFRRCIFHGTAFLWRGKAYLFIAPSGTGKSTQYILWKLVYGDEIRILNGDKPILEFRENGEIWVHPSPWQGKENIGRLESAPLGGLIYLRQSPDNRVAPMTAREAVLPVLGQFIFSRRDREDVLAVCAMEEALLARVPVWRLDNRGDEASAVLCHDFIAKEMGQ